MTIAGLVKFEVLPKWLPKFSKLMEIVILIVQIQINRSYHSNELKRKRKRKKKTFKLANTTSVHFNFIYYYC
jgi:hypothetical protein